LVDSGPAIWPGDRAPQLLNLLLVCRCSAEEFGRGRKVAEERCAGSKAAENLGGTGGTRQQSAIGLRRRIGTKKRARAEHRERPGVWCLSGIDKGLFCNFATKSLKSGHRKYYSYVVARSNARVVCIGLFAEDDAAYRHISLLFLHPISTHIDSYPPSSATPYRHVST
jgi:hypothetical protein